MNEGYTKVFVSLDGTEQQDFVLARAIKVAANNGAKLIIGHVIDSTALESAGSYPVDLVNGLEEAFKNSIAKQLEEAKANPDIPEVEVMIRAGRIRETLKDEMLDVVKKSGALVTPGDCFEEPKSMRIGYAYSDNTDDLQKGLDAISAYMRTLE